MIAGIIWEAILDGGDDGGVPFSLLREEIVSTIPIWK